MRTRFTTSLAVGAFSFKWSGRKHTSSRGAHNRACKGDGSRLRGRSRVVSGRVGATEQERKNVHAALGRRAADQAVSCCCKREVLFTDATYQIWRLLLTFAQPARTSNNLPTEFTIKTPSRSTSSEHSAHLLVQSDTEFSMRFAVIARRFLPSSSVKAKPTLTPLLLLFSSSCVTVHCLSTVQRKNISELFSPHEKSNSNHVNN